MCLTRKEEIFLQLCRFVNFGDDDDENYNDLSTTTDEYNDNENLDNDTCSSKEPLYAGERLRVKINNLMRSQNY